ncbi:MAG: heptaprenylglyceryl phosphate synthase [Mycobacterium leprae]
MNVNAFWPDPPDWRRWRHVTKLDPDRPLKAEALKLVYASGTDAIMVGGSSGVTRSAVATLLRQLADSPLPVALEVSTPESVMPGPALFLIPVVLNSRSGDWLTGNQSQVLAELLPTFGSFIPWSLLLPEAYLVLNPEATVARLTDAQATLDSKTAAGYAAFAGRVLRLPLLYVEYSGTFGDMSLLQSVRSAAGDAHIIYGGGITTAAQAEAAGRLADTVVVGNLIYHDPNRLRETVEAISKGGR